ncbi:MAG: hypothetical protein R3257_00240, partial [bacterium]|nr:hypothetical protein [bacterium]
TLFPTPIDHHSLKKAVRIGASRYYENCNAAQPERVEKVTIHGFGGNNYLLNTIFPCQPVKNDRYTVYIDVREIKTMEGDPYLPNSGNTRLSFRTYEEEGGGGPGPSVEEMNKHLTLKDVPVMLLHKWPSHHKKNTHFSNSNTLFLTMLFSKKMNGETVKNAITISPCGSQPSCHPTRVRSVRTYGKRVPYMLKIKTNITPTPNTIYKVDVDYSKMETKSGKKFPFLPDNEWEFSTGQPDNW